jgi:hypothetical protein
MIRAVNYCRSNPLDKLVDAAKALIKELQSSKTIRLPD